MPINTRALVEGMVARTAWLLRSILSVGILAGSGLLPAHAEKVEVSLDSSVDVTHASGPAAATVPLSPNGAYAVWLGTDVTGPFRGWDGTLSSIGHWVDNPLIDSRRLAAESLYGEFAKGTRMLRLGDYQCSQTVTGLDNNIRGIYFRTGEMEYGEPQLSVAAGIIPRDDQRNWPAPERQPKATVYSFLAKHALSSSVTVGLEYANSRDYEHPLPDAPLFHGAAYGLTWIYEPIWGVKFAGESFLSQRRRLTQGGDQHGSAHRFTFTGDGETSRLTVVYERVSPYFVTTTNQLDPDREWARASWREKLRSDRTLTYSVYWTHDNLDGTGLATSSIFKPMVRLDARHLWGRPWTQAGLSAYLLKTRALDGAGNPYTTQTPVVRLDFGHRIGRVALDLGVERQVGNVTEGAVPEQNLWNLDTTLSTSLFSRENLYRLELSMANSLSQEVLTGLTRDTATESYALGLNTDLPKARLQTSLRMGVQKTRGGGRTATGFATGSVYWKPAWPSMPLRDTVVYLRGSYNNLDSETLTDEYRAQSITLGMSWLY